MNDRKPPACDRAESQPSPRVIALIGYRGSGKTTVAKRLAALLDWTWHDADIELEAEAGCTIQDIFRDSGEGVFRDIESRVLGRLLTGDGTVVALGGGVILRPANRARLRMATVIWLRAAPDILLRRIEGDPTTAARRPNLTAEGGLAEIHRLLDERAPYYAECADHIVDTDTKGPQQIAEEIVSLLKGPPLD